MRHCHPLRPAERLFRFAQTPVPLNSRAGAQRRQVKLSDLQGNVMVSILIRGVLACCRGRDVIPAQSLNAGSEAAPDRSRCPSALIWQRSAPIASLAMPFGQPAGLEADVCTY